MPRIGHPDADSLHKVTCELLFFGATIAVRYFQREYITPGRPDFLPVFMEFGVVMVGLWGFSGSGYYLILDAIDSPHARRVKRGRI
ncbi:unnamed protein product [Urochloa decumbens]|uniref:Uncharacterized protein n=1 Tax=Urochloa decumbens TaxID=240449 RepID=A0ABC8YLG6_9POAL